MGQHILNLLVTMSLVSDMSMKTKLKLAIALAIPACLTQVTIVSPALAQAPGRPPGTRAEFDALLAEVVRSADALATQVREQVAIQREVDRWSADTARHRAGRVTRDPNNPGPANEYDRAAGLLDERRDQLRARRALNDGMVGNARTHFSFSMAPLRLASVLQELEPWRQRIVACAALTDAIQAAACLRQVWEQMPRIRRRS